MGNLQNDKCLFLVRDPSGNATRGKTPPASAMHSAACRHIHDASVDSEPMLALTFSPSTGEAGGAHIKQVKRSAPALFYTPKKMHAQFFFSLQKCELGLIYTHTHTQTHTHLQAVPSYQAYTQTLM